jgi:hypothetical protein
VHEAKVKITIIPGPSAQADDETKGRLVGFELNLVPDEFGTMELQNVFGEVWLKREVE